MTTTIPYAPGDPAWLEQRRTFLGASDVPAVLGLSPYRTPLDVWAEKVGLIVPGVGGSLATELGHELEDLIARKWSEQHPTADVQHALVTVRHPDLPWLAASTDREVDGDGLLECKLVGGRQTARWDAGVPADVRAQCVAQMAVTGRRWVDVCSLHAGNGWEHRIERVQRDDGEIAGLVARLDRWWHDHVVTGVRPELTGDPTQVRRALGAAYPGDGSAISLPGVVLEQVADLKRAKALLRDLERDVKRAENELVGVLGDAEEAFGDPDAKPVVTYRRQQRTSHDLDAIRSGIVPGCTPDEVAAARRVLAAVASTTSYRVLRLA